MKALVCGASDKARANRRHGWLSPAAVLLMLAIVPTFPHLLLSSGRRLGSHPHPVYAVDLVSLNRVG